MLSEAFMDDNEPAILIFWYHCKISFFFWTIQGLYDNLKNRCLILTPRFDIKAFYSAYS